MANAASASDIVVTPTVTPLPPLSQIGLTTQGHPTALTASGSSFAWVTTRCSGVGMPSSANTILLKTFELASMPLRKPSAFDDVSTNTRERQPHPYCQNMLSVMNGR